MAISVGQVQALTQKGIVADGGLKDAVFKTHVYLERLRKKQKAWSGYKLTIPFNYFDDTQTSGSYYVGPTALSHDFYDPITELSFDLVELQETIAISHRDIALNSGKHAILKLVKERLKIAEKGMQQRFTKGLFSDGTASTGALTTDQFDGIQTFLKSSAVSYGGVSSSDVSAHVAVVLDNSSVDRALTTSLHQSALGQASEGNERPTLGIMRQNVMDKFIELLKPHQRLGKDNVDGLGHGKNTLVYSGVDHIVDNLAPEKSIAFLNENFVHLYAHPEYDMVRNTWDKLENKDAMMERIFWKGTYACSVLRYQAWLKDIAVA